MNTLYYNWNIIYLLNISKVSFDRGRMMAACNLSAGEWTRPDIFRGRLAG